MKYLYLMFAFATFQCYAQDDSKEINAAEERLVTGNDKQFEVFIKKNNTYAPGYLNNIPAAVLSGLTTGYPQATNVSCFVDEKFSTLYFQSKQQTVIVKYTNDGATVWLRKTYSADQLDPRITAFLKDQISAAYQIKYITETSRDEIHHFEINLANEKQWMMVKLSGEPAAGNLVVTGKQVFTN
jgi:hypothetical protein